MSKTRYSPRLKKGIFGEKSYILTSKKFTNLKKKKWSVFLKNRLKSFSLIRNDIFLIHSKVGDLRKNYKKGLLQKQKFLAFFCNFKRTFLKKLLRGKKKHLILNFIDRVQLRLDLALFKANFVNSLYCARFFIHQKQIYVNGSLINSPAYILKVGDIVELKTKTTPTLFSDVSFNLPVPHLEVNYEILTFIVIKKPSEEVTDGIFFHDVIFYNLFELKNFIFR